MRLQTAKYSNMVTLSEVRNNYTAIQYIEQFNSAANIVKTVLGSVCFFILKIAVCERVKNRSAVRNHSEEIVLCLGIHWSRDTKEKRNGPEPQSA